MVKIIPRELIKHLEWSPDEKSTRIDKTPDNSRSEFGGEVAHNFRGNAVITKILITVGCVLLVGMHLLWPEIKLDIVTVCLLVIAVLPWTAAIIKSIELPGGFKVDLQEVKSATDKVTAGKALVTVELESPGKPSSLDFLRGVSRSDPNLALVGLRIEIERRLSELAHRAQIQTERRSASALLRDLAKGERIDGMTVAGLSELIALGNQAAHGAEVSASAAEWALDTGPVVLDFLDSLLLQDARRPNTN